MNYQTYVEGVRVNKPSLPYAEPILKPNRPAQAARAQARTTTYHKTSLYQRTLTQIGDWIKSRVSAIRIGSALAPFVRNAARSTPAAVTDSQVKALNQALSAAQSISAGAEEVVSQAIRKAMDPLDRMGRQALRNQLSGDGRLCGSISDKLMYEVTGSVQEAIAADADFFVLAALDSIAAMDHSPLLAGQVVSHAGPYLNGHRQVVSPDQKSTFEAGHLLPPERQLACLSAKTQTKVQSWFSAQPPAAQQRVKAAISVVVGDRMLQAADASDSAKRNPGVLRLVPAGAVIGTAGISPAGA